MNRGARRAALAFIVFLLGAVSVINAGPLADKATLFDAAIQHDHCPNGLVFDVTLDDHGKLIAAHGGGDASIWTGAYAAAQAWRFRATHDPQALANIERSLQAFHNLQAVTGYPGFCGRAWGEEPWFRTGHNTATGAPPLSHLKFIADTSRDQYTGLLLAYTLTWPLLDKVELKKTVQADVRAIARNLIDHNLALMSRVGGEEKTQFNLNPTYCYQDRINPHEWAVVDDFPANVFAHWVPFDERLAHALSTLSPPPIRGGEALRALMMLCTAATITADLDIQKYYRDELCTRREFPRVASETGQLVEDIYAGRGTDRLARISDGIATALFDVAGEVCIAYGWLPRPLWTLGAALPRCVIAHLGEQAGRELGSAMAAMNRPGAMHRALGLKPPLNQLANLLARCGARKLAEKVTRECQWLDAIAQSNLDEASDAMRSYVGCNLTFFALTGLLETDNDPQIRAAAVDILERAFEPIADEGNALYTYIRAAFGRTPLSPHLLAAAKDTLLRYPGDRRSRRFDHSHDPGLRILPWPDRFGRTGNQASKPFPIDQRHPDIFPWQNCPRQIVDGSDGNVLIAPVGYLTAYWFARAHGLLTADD